MTKKTVLVTGCSSGIGRSVALEFTRRGYEVTASARRLSSLEGLDVAHHLALDVDSDASVAAAIAALGPLDVRVNNAGFGIEGSVEEVPLDDVRRAFETNFFGAARMIQGVLPSMRERSTGLIINVTSIAGIAAPPLAGYYAATKFALEALSESLSIEVGHFGVKVMIVEPGGVATEFGNNMVDFRDRPGPYTPLAEQWAGAMVTLRGGQASPGPDSVAVALCDAAEQENPPLRLPVGTDAELIATTRAALNTTDFQNAIRDVLKISW